MIQRNNRSHFPVALLIGIALLSAVAVFGPVCRAAESPHGVFFLPGYPANTEEAQPTLDQFSALLAEQLPKGNPTWTFSYHPQLESGRLALETDATHIAMVSIHAFMEYRVSHDLRPLLTVETRAGATERWSLVAAKGRVQSSADLAGFEISGMPGYSDAFVRWILRDWGALPADVKTTFTSRMLSKLRLATRGSDVAVLVDGEQHDALSQLPFASELEVVARSGEVPIAVVCLVGDRGDPKKIAALQEALLQLAGSAEAELVLQTMRMRSFRPLDAARLDSTIESYDALKRGE